MKMINGYMECPVCKKLYPTMVDHKYIIEYGKCQTCKILEKLMPIHSKGNKDVYTDVSPVAKTK